jgi:hypothetical protein
MSAWVVVLPCCWLSALQSWGLLNWRLLLKYVQHYC